MSEAASAAQTLLLCFFASRSGWWWCDLSQPTKSVFFCTFFAKMCEGKLVFPLAEIRSRIHCSLVGEDARDDEIKGVTKIFEAICSKISTFYFNLHTRSNSQSWFPQWDEGRQNVVFMSLRYNRGHDYYCRNDKCQISCQIMPLYYWLQCNIGRGFDFYFMKYCTIWNCSMNSKLSCVWCEFVLQYDMTLTTYRSSFMKERK